MADRPLLVLIGPPAAGKTRIGKRVARQLGAPFVDTDRRIVHAHGPIAQIFAEQGEPAFRALERVAVSQALTEPGAVVALGGGAMLNPDTQEQLREHRVALVTISPEAARIRLDGSPGTRPLLAEGFGAWERLVAERMPLYERLALRSWDTSSSPVTRIAEEIARWVRDDEGAEES